MFQLFLFSILLTNLHASTLKKASSGNKSEDRQKKDPFNQPENHSFSIQLSWGDEKNEPLTIFFDDKKYYPEKNLPHRFDAKRYHIEKNQ